MLHCTECGAGGNWDPAILSDACTGSGLTALMKGKKLHFTGLLGKLPERVLMSRVAHHSNVAVVQIRLDK